MKNKTQTIRKIVGFLNHPDEDGGFWLPNIQRPFVWSEEQICKLFDSILREYPISTLLIWKTVSTISHRKFIDNWKDTLQLSDFYVPDHAKKKCLVLDGQQRLQSLFIGLCGSFEGKELCLDVLSGNDSAPDDVKYEFKFIDPASIVFPQVKFKDLIFTQKRNNVVLRELRAAAGRILTEAEANKIADHLELIAKTCKTDEIVTYQELDSIDNPDLYKDDDVVEIFIRANSGGTKLGKSDLLFSLLVSTWDDAGDKMRILLDELNRYGFDFTRDFMLKTCLTLLDYGARYEVKKFRKPGVREEIEAKWDDIAAATKAVLDFIHKETFIRCDKALPSYLVLIPLIYVRYRLPKAWKQAKGKDSYLLRSSLAGAFSGTPDQLIDDLVKTLKDLGCFDLNEVFGVIRSANRSLELTAERFWEMGYGSNNIYLLFNLWYRDFDFDPAFDGNLPQVDHIFPQSLLREVKKANPETGRKDLMRYPPDIRNQLANCMLLTAEENGSGGKSDTPPDEWFVGDRAKDDYLDMHLIPKDPALWKLERFEDFIEARKNLIREKFKYLLVPTTSANMRSKDE